MDETSAAVPDTLITIEVPGAAPIHLATDFAGRAQYLQPSPGTYHIRLDKPGYYSDEADENDASVTEINLVLSHTGTLVEQVDVTATPAGIDPDELSDKSRMATPEILNIPYPTSRDIRQLLKYFPGVVQDQNGQNHLVGSSAWSIIYTLDGFDVRSPLDGNLSLRFSADAVRAIDREATRYLPEYGRGTGGVIAFDSAMGDNKFRVHVTDFMPQYQETDGLRFDRLVPRLNISGPIQQNRSWFFDGVETEFNQDYVKDLPRGQNINLTARGSNLLRTQWNLASGGSVKAGLLFNDFHSPYVGLSPFDPAESTRKQNVIAWFPYARLQQKVGNALLDMGLGVVRFTESHRPYQGSVYTKSPNGSDGSYFESMSDTSQNVEGNAWLYLAPREWLGRHDLKVGADLEQTRIYERFSRKPVEYLRADGTLLRMSTFPGQPAFTRHDLELGAFLEDHWAPNRVLLIEPGVRFDWNEIVRKPLVAPRVSIAVVPDRGKPTTKIAAGIGVYYERTQLEYLACALGGVRDDTYYAADGVTPMGPPVRTTFVYNQHSLRQPYAINWSMGVEQQLPGRTDLKVNYIQKIVRDEFTYVNESGPGALWGTYRLANTAEDRDKALQIEAKRTFRSNYAIYGAYTRSFAHTNAAINYTPAVSYLGPQQGGPVAWDVPDHVIAWGWMPLVPGVTRNWDLVAAVDWHTGFPYTAIDANEQVVGAPNSYRFPNYLSVNPGIEWRFHFRGSYFGLRAVMENATHALDAPSVNNNVDSASFGHFQNPPGIAFTARLRLIEAMGKGK
ncbi:MAG TPA: hypothetical protein VGJ21_22830 [Terracidiphilus sp.]